MPRRAEERELPHDLDELVHDTAYVVRIRMIQAVMKRWCWNPPAVEGAIELDETGNLRCFQQRENDEPFPIQLALDGLVSE